MGIPLPLDADDLVQDALLGVLKSGLRGKAGREIDQDAPVLAESLKTAMSNACRQHQRTARRRMRLLARCDIGATVQVDGDRKAYCVLLAKDVQQALSRLPPERRKAAVGCLLEGRSAFEVGQVSGKREKTVRNYLDRSKPLLRTALYSYRAPKAD